MRNSHKLYYLTQLAKLATIKDMANKAQKQETVTIIEAAEMLGVSVGTLRRRVADGAIQPLPTPPLLKQPRRLEFLRSDIEKLLQS